MLSLFRGVCVWGSITTEFHKDFLISVWTVSISLHLCLSLLHTMYLTESVSDGAVVEGG